jgi:FkbM family methyltransferase
MFGVLDKLVELPFGSFAFRQIQPLIRRIRRRMYPGIPSDHGITTVSYGGRQFRFEHRRWDEDQWAIRQCFAESQYDLPIGAHGIFVQDLYKRILSSGRKPLIVDCGANIGASVAWFSARFPGSHVVAVEPAPDNFALLTRNTAVLDVDLRHGAIAKVDGTAYLHLAKGGMGHRADLNEGGVEIQAFSVRSLLASKSPEEYTPFLLKIDIEGAEKSLFDGDTSAFDRFPLIILEPHDWRFPGNLSSQSFFRYHVESGREFCMRHENVASIVCDSRLREIKEGLRN